MVELHCKVTIGYNPRRAAPAGGLGGRHRAGQRRVPRAGGGGGAPYSQLGAQKLSKVHIESFY